MEEKEEINEMSNGEYITIGDEYFCSFYYEAVKRLLDIDSKANVSYLYRYAKIFNKCSDCFCKLKAGPKSRDYVELLKGSFYFRLIYVYRNATLLSSAVAFHFWNVYKKDPKSIKRLIKKKIVKLCSIGGGSIPDIVAIITVLKSIALKKGIELDFRVTIIGFNADWKNTCIRVLGCLEEFCEATWKIDFIESDFPKIKTWTWTTEALKAIQEADVITVVRLVLNLNVKRKIVTMLCNELKTQGILLILDCPRTKFIKFCLGITDLGDFHLIHAELCDYHTLDIQAVKHLRALYQKHFGNEKLLSSNFACDLFVSVWIKASSEMDTRHKDNLECISQTNAEKYNAKQGFLSNNALTKWENLFTQKKLAAGWKPKRIKKFVQKEKGKRNNMFGKFIPQKKGVDLLHDHLMSQAQLLDSGGKEFSETEKSLDEYLIQKRRYSTTKQNAYSASLIVNNLCYTN